MENLVGYAKRDLMIPQAPFGDLAAAHGARRAADDGKRAARPAAVAAGQHRQGNGALVLDCPSSRSGRWPTTPSEACHDRGAAAAGPGPGRRAA